MLYPKGPLLAALRDHPELEERMFNALRRITPSQLLCEGRVYGGGLHEVETKELAQIPAREVLASYTTTFSWGTSNLTDVVEHAGDDAISPPSALSYSFRNPRLQNQLS
jgi:hypothetical protein